MFVLIDENGVVMSPNIDPNDPLNKETFEAGHIIEAPEGTIYGDTWDGKYMHQTGDRTPREEPEAELDPIQELRDRMDAQAALIAHLMGAEVELTHDIVERAGIEAELIPSLDEIVAPGKIRP